MSILRTLCLRHATTHEIEIKRSRFITTLARDGHAWSGAIASLSDAVVPSTRRPAITAGLPHRPAGRRTAPTFLDDGEPRWHLWMLEALRASDTERHGGRHPLLAASSGRRRPRAGLLHVRVRGRRPRPIAYSSGATSPRNSCSTPQTRAASNPGAAREEPRSSTRSGMRTSLRTRSIRRPRLD